VGGDLLTCQEFRVVRVVYWAVGSALLAGIVSCHVALTQGQAIAGVPRVVDGDTIRFGEIRIRLHGIDAPEADQWCNAADGGSWACGSEATRELTAMLAGAEVTCQPITLDRYGRTVARCLVGSLDIEAEMVRRGLAWAFVRYSRDYVAQEAEARAAHRGIWQAATQTAWDFRATRWAEYDKGAPVGCAIKGNVNGYGEKIYHVPWGRDYAKVKMDLTKGKRWFCSEGEAEQAGWRAAR
jgi:endonuclease YncB( thermonuclease family)